MHAAAREGCTMIMPSPGRVFWLVAASCFLLSSCSGEKPKPPPPEAGYIVVKTETVPLFVELAGRTTAYEMSEVRPQVSGVVKARQFTEGSLVRAGQTLYQIDPSLYRAALSQAAANLDNARAQPHGDAGDIVLELKNGSLMLFPHRCSHA